MKKTVITIILAIAAAAAMVWAGSINTPGLAWIPGYFVAVFCIIGILEVHSRPHSK